MYDMLHYLERRFSSPGDTRLLVAATRHEDGTFSGPDVMEWHRQRGRLLRSLDDVEGAGSVEYSVDVDAPDPRETGYAIIDIPVALAQFAGAVAGIVSLWISARPRKDRDSVPGIRMELPGKSLIISSEIPEGERETLARMFINAS